MNNLKVKLRKLEIIEILDNADLARFRLKSRQQLQLRLGRPVRDGALSTHHTLRIHFCSGRLQRLEYIGEAEQIQDFAPAFFLRFLSHICDTKAGKFDHGVGVF